MSGEGTDLPEPHHAGSTSTQRELKVMTPLPASAPLIGSWLWGMEETRRGLLATVRGLDQQQLDWRGPTGRDNSIGSLLYHIALVELDWLHYDLLLTEPPQEVLASFPHHHRTPDGRLAHVEGVSIDDHLERMALVRRHFLEALRPMSLQDWHAVREPEGVDYAVTPAWTVFHLVEHEAGHLFEIRALKRRWLEANGA